MSKSLYDYCIERDDFVLLVQWDKEQNGELTTRNVSYGSHIKAWWRCEFGHQWRSAVYSRTHAKTGCPYCAGNRNLCASSPFAVSYPELMAEWHPTLNGDLSPDEIAPGTHRKIWWKCKKGHEWKAEVKSRVQGSGCPVCANRKIKVGENDLATTHPEIAAQWHPTRNGNRTPRDVVAGNHAKVWWQCEKGHEWQAVIQARTATGSGCPVCAGKVVLPGINDLGSVAPAIAAQWHPEKNGPLTPEQVTSLSNRKAWWLCSKGHAYQTVIANRVRNATGCPYCGNQKVLVGFNDLETVAPAIAQQWNPDLNGELTPRMVTAGSHRKVWWQCADGHVWKAFIYARTGPQKTGCPVCAGKVKPDARMRHAAILTAGRKVAADIQEKQREDD